MDEEDPAVALGVKIYMLVLAALVAIAAAIGVYGLWTVLAGA